MKTSNVLATVLFGAIAAAVPFDRRALITKTSLVTETVVVYTTVYDDDLPIATATTTPGLFFEKPSSIKAVSTSIVPTTTAVYTPPVVETPKSSAPASSAPASSAPAPSSVYTPSVYTPPAPAPTSTYVAPVEEAPLTTVAPAPAPEPTSTYVAPVVEAPSSTYVAPAPVASAVEAAQPSTAPSTAPTTSTPTGDKMHGDITIYDNTGAAGACGKALYDTDMIVALAAPTWGQSTYDVMTGESTNPWCGQKITVEYKGNQIEATIMDLCPGCTGEDIDLSLAAWKALTGLDEKTRLQADWWKS